MAIDGLRAAVAPSERAQVDHRNPVREEGVVLVASCERDSDHLAVIVDRVGAAVDPAERPQIVHGTMIEEGMNLPSCGERITDYLAAPIDRRRVAHRAA